MLNQFKNKIGDMALKKNEAMIMKKPRPDEGIIALSSYTTIIKKSIKIMYFKTDPLQNILSHEKRNSVCFF